MKKILLLAFLFVSLFASAQKDVTTFLGIPVDGTKAAMKQKLIEKGFTPQKIQNNEFFEGEFNGAEVRVFIATNNNKVYRIMLCDVNRVNEAQIKIRFNRLVDQFLNNKRYGVLTDPTIPESENIGYEMAVKNKRYDASFYQLPDLQKMDTLAMGKMVVEELLEKYTEEQLANPTEEIIKERDKISLKKGLEYLEKKHVWFIIVRELNEYYIAMYYDNEYNHANGEDL